MNNLVIGLKRFFTNKNVVTIILVLVALGLLFWGYTSTIKKETNTISVPVAVEKINPKTKITSEMIETKEVAGSLVDETVITSSYELIDRYTNINVTVPAGSMFYSEWIVDESELPGQWIETLAKENKLPYYMDSDGESTYGNSVMPDSYVDFYAKITDENGTVMFGRFMKNVNILVVHDSDGNDVFADNSEIAETAKLGFGVSQDYFILLKKMSYLDVELVLVPRGMEVPYTCSEEENCITITSSAIRDYIDAQAITIEEDVIEEATEQSTEVTTNTETVVE